MKKQNSYSTKTSCNKYISRKMIATGEHSIIHDQLRKHLHCTSYWIQSLMKYCRKNYMKEENENSIQDKRVSEKEWDVRSTYLE